MSKSFAELLPPPDLVCRLAEEAGRRIERCLRYLEELAKPVREGKSCGTMRVNSVPLTVSTTARN